MANEVVAIDEANEIAKFRERRRLTMDKDVEKIMRVALLIKITKEATRYIDEGVDYFAVDCGGFSLTFNAIKKEAKV